MLYPKIALAQSIIEILKQKNIRNIVISPGSRNAPLTIGFVNNPFFKCYSIADERCAGFFALGIAQQINEPVVLVCTSGSALLNYYPAFSEAFYSQIPLIVLSADRPLDKIDIGDGQTIRQQNVFANHSLFNANLNENVSDENDFLINEAINKAIFLKGPTHINAPFEEPLYQTTAILSVAPKIINHIDVEPINFAENLSEFATIWNSSKRKLFLIGVNQMHVLSEEIIEKIANDASIVVLTETTSNLHHPNFINTIDTLITPFTNEDFENFRPDILITFGGMLVSKRIKAFLRNYQPSHHWHIDNLRAYDTFGCLSEHFKCNPEYFFSKFLPFTQFLLSDYYAKIQAINQNRIEKTKEYLANVRFSDLTVFNTIIPKLNKNSQLQISNSSAIRYAQLIEIDPSIAVFSNRGTSGIDGSTSTAIGAAVVNNKQTTFITGDVGFLYDSNALWNNYIPKNFKIILMNNGGGGIFRILPGHDETPVFNTFFETIHNFTAEHLAKMYHFKYLKASNQNELDAALKELFENDNQPTILEITTPTFCNDSVLLNYFKFLQ